MENSKLIWQSSSPAPYESGWSVFAKLLALNALKPRIIKESITLSSDSDCNLKYWKSSWIDFSKFSKALSVEEYRLRQCFLDQLGFKSNQLLYIRNCHECSKLGYHCVFFQLPFLTHCPWHGLELSFTCHDCKETVNTKGLRNIETSEGKEWFSSCGHIHYIDFQGGSYDTLATIQKFCIVDSCTEFLKWLKIVSTSLEASQFLTSISIDTVESKKSMYLQAVESFAGKSPWYISIPRHNIRTLFWKASKKDCDYLRDTMTVKRKSDIDISYRSLRRYLYKEYVKPHRLCWNELINTDYFGSQTLNSNKVCTVALAYATWRLSIENFINIEALKSNKYSEKPISILEIPGSRFRATNNEICALLYAYFFYIWEDIQLIAGKSRYSLVKNDEYIYAANFALVYVGGNWNLLIPDPSSLEAKSCLQCVGSLKPKNWMKAKGLVNTEWRIDEAVSTRTIFRLEIDFEENAYTFIKV